MTTLVLHLNLFLSFPHPVVITQPICPGLPVVCLPSISLSITIISSMSPLFKYPIHSFVSVSYCLYQGPFLSNPSHQFFICFMLSSKFFPFFTRSKFQKPMHSKLEKSPVMGQCAHMGPANKLADGSKLMAAIGKKGSH